MVAGLPETLAINRAAPTTDAPSETRAAPSALKNQARGGAMGEQTPVVIYELSFGGANAPAPAQHNSLRLDHSCLRRKTSLARALTGLAKIPANDR